MLALVRTAYARWVPLIGREPAPMTDDYAARIAAGQGFVLEAPDGRILGLVVLEEEPEALLLDNIAIAPEAQGQGLGHGLMDFIEAEARRRGHRLIRIFINAAMEANIRLYESLGFVETHRAMQGAFRRVNMEKRLP
ncbi:N-acetyltransferase [Siccirubricoccus sp. G192]|uniref:GNAT family N-acetyltransferase n=1 Tax=Siccirubricoccus sp. G192 TaxID=2849651 RepID=UPI0020C4ABDB|nr:GNAT family N-acetyltransferase [Siccirubricoccus sp. G192]